MSIDPSTEKTERINALNSESRTLRDSDPIQSSALASEALTMAKQCNPPHGLGMAQSYYHLAFASYRQGKVEDALEHAFAALGQYNELGERQGEFDCNFLIGYVYIGIDNYSTALGFFMSCLKLAEEIKLPVNLAKSYHSIAIIQSQTGEHAQAIESNQRAIAVFRAENDQLGLAAALNSCCIDYRHLGQLEDALQCGEESYRCVCQTENSTYWQATSLSTIGEVYWAKGEYASALEKFESSLELFAKSRSNNYMLEQIETLYHKANCLLALGREDESLQTFAETLTNAVQYQSKRIASYCHREIAKIYESRQQFDKAYDHFRFFHQFDKQVFDEDKTKQVTKLEAVYRLQQIQSEVEHQKTLREQDRLHFEQISALTSKFIRNLTHDLKNPLTIILLLLENLETRLGHEAQEKYSDILEKARRNLNRMNYLIVDLLELTKLESKRENKLTSVDIRELIHNVEDNWSNSARERHIKLTFQTQLIDPIVYIDPDQITRAFENLISNAIKYTPSGGSITIETQQSAEMLIFKVSDTGIGIPAAEISNIFLPFYRVQQHRHDAAEGTGLGLAIVELIIKNHHGTISVESEVNQGSTFRFAIPWRTTAND